MAAERKRKGFHVATSSRWLLVPGTTFMVVFLLVPFIFVVLHSFWSLQNYRVVTDFTLQQYAEVFTNATFLKTLAFTVRTSLIVLAIVLAASYPVAYFLAKVVQSEKWKIVILLVCLTPFWTSYIIRAIAWMPMMGRGGFVNLILMKLGIISKPIDMFLFSEPAVLFGMFYLLVVFAIGPIFFSIAKIDDRLIEAAKNLGAGAAKAFLTVTLPLSLPGVMASSIFVFTLTMGEFATPRIIGAGHGMMFANIVVDEVFVLEWPLASALSVVLVAVTMAGVGVMLRFVDIRREL